MYMVFRVPSYKIVMGRRENNKYKFYNSKNSLLYKKKSIKIGKKKFFKFSKKKNNSGFLHRPVLIDRSDCYKPQFFHPTNMYMVFRVPSYKIVMGRRDRMVVGLITTYAISVYLCEFEPSSWRGILDTTLCDKVCW
jgi:hypothetical protein